jgi:acylpyruvate hydrolase
MKLATFETRPVDLIGPRVGLVLEDGAVADLSLAYQIFLSDRRDPGAIAQRAAWGREGIIGFLKGGSPAIETARRVLGFVREARQRGVELKGAKGTPALHEAGQVRFLAPIPRPGKVIAMGFNFEDHLRENPKAVRPRFPMGFLQASSTIIGHEDPVFYPRDSQELDYEVEVAFVVGRGGKYIPPERALDHIAGYTVFNDLSLRDIQRGEMKVGFLLMGKNLDTLAPMGPYLVLSDEIKDPQQLDMELWVNDELRQRGNTRDMIFKLPELVSYWSRMTLEPGDIITSGTPSGVAAFRETPEDYYLKPGDVVRCVVQGIGELRNPIVPGSHPGAV